MDDRAVVAVQLDREPRSRVDVVARCHLGLPTVIRVPPFLDDGTPFPTTYWLTCPLAVRRIGRLEAAGGVRQAEARLAADPGLARAHDAAMARYEQERDASIGEDTGPHRPRGGVGGARAGVKCLHAHYADHAAGNANPVGAITSARIGALDCAVPCVTGDGPGAGANPDWREPRG
jgi:hypothetical protein